MFEQGVSCMLARLLTSIALLSRAVREEPSAKISSSLPSREVTTKFDREHGRNRGVSAVCSQ